MCVFSVLFCSEVSGIACNCQLSTQVTGRGLPLLQGLCTYFSWLSCNRKWNVLFQLVVAVANHQLFSQDYHSSFKKLSRGQKLCGPSFSPVPTNAVPTDAVFTMTVLFPPSPNVSTTPITTMGCRQCLPLSVVQLKGKHCQKLHCRNGVVDTFGPTLLSH